ncbi:retroviral-like aspartic protease family protein [Sphingobium boeckii]|uniref:Putative aspartyl protease n=1 Tax=Sphingobium boeckii TaxID=1082345 RepID=A0A7W9AF12_9SPHN|nr:retroviral-like aspartic protease family protein [Sphingobium boeckii]MBB5684388.1 putative aspartyl protease [Sphingobium boeckii]
MSALSLLRPAWLAGLCLAASAPAQDVVPLADEAAAYDVILLGSDRTMRMTVPVSVGSSGPYAFVVDTGAERTVISRELAGELGLDPAGSITMHSMSGTAPVDTVMIPRLILSKGTVRDIRAPSIGRVSLGAAGMLGIDSLQKQRILLDFLNGTMTITPSKEREQRRDNDEIIVTAQSRFGQLVLVDASVGKDKIHVIIDTGAQVSVGNEALRRRVAGRKAGKLFQPIDLMSVTGGKISAVYSTIPNIRIGGVNMTDLPVAFADAPPFKKLGLEHKPALLLGMDGLKLFDRVSVDFAKRRVRFLMPEGGNRDNDMLVSTDPAGIPRG